MSRVVAICGGVGGAKLALGLLRVLGPELTVIVNTGDDFDHLGLTVSPDIDTVLYTLSGRSDEERGWGRAGETWAFMRALGEIGGETWFQLGDLDLALHVERTRRLRAGESLSAVTRDIAARFGIAAKILPMSDDPVRTIVETPDGPLPFQRYFVERRCAPVVRALRFEGAAAARAAPEALAALRAPALDAVILCPSNPYLSIDPILAVPDLRVALGTAKATVIAVSPIVSGKAVKGPTAKIMAELGLPVSHAVIARHYEGLIHGLVVDESDGDADELGVPSHVTRTLMTSLADREALARACLAFAGELRGRSA